MEEIDKKKTGKTGVAVLVAGMLALCFLLGGCGSSRKAVETAGVGQAEDTGSAVQEAGQSPDSGSQNGFTFTDDLGREVTVDAPERVAALLGSFTDTWLLAGGEVCAAANDSWESLGLPLGEDVVNLGSILEPDVEKLIDAEPDFVLASANTEGHLGLEDVLKKADIPVAYFAVSCFEEYLHMLDVCTQITGRRDLYEQNGIRVKEEIARIKERVDGSAPTVLFLRAASANVKAKGSKGTVCGEMLKDLGCVNIADSDKGLLEDLSMEAIIAGDPDHIFVTVQGNDQEAAMENVEEMLVSDPAWATLKAVQNGNYHVLDKRLFNLKPNARWGEAYGQLADILYPVDR